MIDSHCHIGFENENLDALMIRAANNSVSRMLTVACDSCDFLRLIQLLNQEKSLYGACGIHPENADKLPNKSDFFNIIQSNNKIVGVGEIGLDYHYMTLSRDIQLKAFEQQIEWAAELNKPIIIHTREAEEDTISVLNSAGELLKNGGVLHCFTGSMKLAEKALSMGLYISASGVITFKNAEEIRNVFRCVPVNRLLIETDSPYMAPIPYRGKTNEPSYLIETAKKLSEITGLNMIEIDRITTENFNRLFQIEDTKNES